MTDDKRFRWRRQGGGFMGAAFDEVFHPDAKAARLIWEVQTELPAPAAIAEDPPHPDLDAGRITLMLPQRDEGDSPGRGLPGPNRQLPD